MIQKLDILKNIVNCVDKDGLTRAVSGPNCVCAMNELIDVVNTLVEETNVYKKVIANLQMKQDNRMIGSVTFDKIEGKMNPEPFDSFAEQRKWIGKLCKFWDDDEPENCVYGILNQVFDIHHSNYQFQCGNGIWYAHCEPVKPDDSLIYTGALPTGR